MAKTKAIKFHSDFCEQGKIKYKAGEIHPRNKDTLRCVTLNFAEVVEVDDEAERIEAERIEAERIEAERIEAERIEAERIEAERIEAERIEAERIEAERIEAEAKK